jgi:hypothetical protein
LEAFVYHGAFGVEEGVEVPFLVDDFGCVGLQGDGGANFAVQRGLLEDGDLAVAFAEGNGLEVGEFRRTETREDEKCLQRQGHQSPLPQ